MYIEKKKSLYSPILVKDITVIREDLEKAVTKAVTAFEQPGYTNDDELNTIASESRMHLLSTLIVAYSKWYREHCDSVDSETETSTSSHNILKLVQFYADACFKERLCLSRLCTKTDILTELSTRLMSTVLSALYAMINKHDGISDLTQSYGVFLDYLSEIPKHPYCLEEKITEFKNVNVKNMQEVEDITAYYTAGAYMVNLADAKQKCKMIMFETGRDGLTCASLGNGYCLINALIVSYFHRTARKDGGDRAKKIRAATLLETAAPTNYKQFFKEIGISDEDIRTIQTQVQATSVISGDMVTVVMEAFAKFFECCVVCYMKFVFSDRELQIYSDRSQFLERTKEENTGRSDLRESACLCMRSTVYPLHYSSTETAHIYSNGGHFSALYIGDNASNDVFAKRYIAKTHALREKEMRVHFVEMSTVPC